MLTIAGACQLSDRLGVAPPLLLLAVGIVVGFLPVVPAIVIEPDLVLQGVLPPLLYSAAASIPAINLRRELGAVAILAVGLVAVSSLVVGLFLAWVIPGLSLGWGVAMGAVLSPTDAVATSIVRRSGVSGRVVTVLEGEGLFNDATALVILSSATAAATAGSVTVGQVLGGFLTSVLVALAVGWLVGEVTLRVRARLTDSTVDTVVSFTVPFLAAIPAEQLGGSGLVAAVVAGVVTGYRGPRLLPPAHRVNGRQNWHTVELVLEGFIFLVMGLELFGVVEEVGTSGPGVATAVAVALGAGALTVVVRAGVVAPMLGYLRRRIDHRASTWQAAQEVKRAFAKRCQAIADGDEEAMSHVPWDRAGRRGRRRPTRLVTVPPRWDPRRRRSVAARWRRTGADVDYFAGQPLGPREGTVIVWAGMRGAVTLAAAQTLPTTAPQRPFLLLVAILVAAGSLVVQGLTLGVVIRLVRPAMAGRADAEEREALVALLVTTAKDTVLGAPPGGPDARDADGLLPPPSSSAPAAGRDHPTAADGAGAAAPRRPISLEAVVAAAQTRLKEADARLKALDVVRAQRVAVLDVRDEGIYCSSTIDYALGRLDYEEIMLTTRPA